MNLRFVVEVEVERESGKFASKDDVREEITQWLEDANQGEISGIGSDSDSIYNVTDWTVSE